MVLKHYYEPFSNPNLSTDHEQKFPIPKNVSSVIESNKGDIGHVHVLYGVKFNGEIDIVQFIFTRCVVYSFSDYFFLLFHSTTYKKYQ